MATADTTPHTEPADLGDVTRWMTGHGLLVAVGLGMIFGIGITVDAIRGAGILAGLLVVGLSFRYPGFILSALLGLMLFQRFQMIQLGVLGVPLSLAKLSALTAIFVFVGQALIRRQRVVVFDPVGLGLMAVVVANLISTLAADDPADSRRRFMSIFLLCTLTYFAYRFVRREHVRFLMNVLPVIMGLLCAVSFWDITHGGVWSRATEIAADSEVVRGGGSFGDPNVWASVNLFFLPYVIFHFSQARHWAVRGYDLAVMLGLIANVGMSFSRAGLLVLGVVLMMLLWQQRARPWLAALVGAGVVAVFLYFVPFEVIEQRFNRLFTNPSQAARGSSLYTRYMVLVGGFEVFMQNPIWGVGPSQYGQYVSYGGMADYGKSAHNIYMQVLVELGVLGAVAFGMLARAVFLLWRRLRAAKLEGWDQHFFRYANLSFLSYVLMGATLNILYHSYMWFMLGVVLSMGRWALEPEAGVAPRRRLDLVPVPPAP